MALGRRCPYPWLSEKMALCLPNEQRAVSGVVIDHPGRRVLGIPGDDLVADDENDELTVLSVVLGGDDSVLCDEFPLSEAAFQEACLAARLAEEHRVPGPLTLGTTLIAELEDYLDGDVLPVVLFYEVVSWN